MVTFIMVTLIFFIKVYTPLSVIVWFRLLVFTSNMIKCKKNFELQNRHSFIKIRWVRSCYQWPHSKNSHDKIFLMNQLKNSLTCVYLYARSLKSKAISALSPAEFHLSSCFWIRSSCGFNIRDTDYARQRVNNSYIEKCK